MFTSCSPRSLDCVHITRIGLCGNLRAGTDQDVLETIGCLAEYLGDAGDDWDGGGGGDINMTQRKFNPSSPRYCTTPQPTVTLSCNAFSQHTKLSFLLLR